MKSIRLAAVALGLLFNAAAALAAPVAWTDWSSVSTGASGSGSGTMTFGSTTVNVGLSGMVGAFVDGTTYYAPYPATYANLAPSDLIQEWSTGSVTLTFSQPVTDLHLALVSVGSGSLPVTYGFDRPFSVLSFGTNNWGYGGYSTVGNSLTGTEFNGVLVFSGTHSGLSFSIGQNEFWHGFNIGAVAAVPEPSALMLLLAGLGLLGVVARRRV